MNSEELEKISKDVDEMVRKYYEDIIITWLVYRVSRCFLAIRQDARQQNRQDAGETEGSET